MVRFYSKNNFGNKGNTGLVEKISMFIKLIMIRHWGMVFSCSKNNDGQMRWEEYGWSWSRYACFGNAMRYFPDRYRWFVFREDTSDSSVVRWNRIAWLTSNKVRCLLLMTKTQNTRILLPRLHPCVGKFRRKFHYVTSWNSK